MVLPQNYIIERVNFFLSLGEIHSRSKSCRSWCMVRGWLNMNFCFADRKLLASTWIKYYLYTFVTLGQVKFIFLLFTVWKKSFIKIKLVVTVSFLGMRSVLRTNALSCINIFDKFIKLLWKPTRLNSLLPMLSSLS